MHSVSRGAFNRPDGSASSGDEPTDLKAATKIAESEDQALDLFEDEEPSGERKPAPVVGIHKTSRAAATVHVTEPVPNAFFPSDADHILGDQTPGDHALEPAAHDLTPERNGRSRLIVGVIIALSAVAAVQAFFLIRGTTRAQNVVAVPATGVVSVESTPAGAAVTVNGEARGVTPLTLTLNPGDYSLEVSSGGVSRSVPVTVAAGTRSSQHVLFGSDDQARGGLQISSQPSGARVTVDDVPRGVTPLSVADLAPGTHTVVLDGPSGTSRQTVTIQPRATASLSVAMPVAGASGGFVRVASPFEVQLYEDGALIGSSQSERIMLPAGRHVIEAVNDALGYRTTHTIQVSPGASASIRVEAPTVSVDINAVPWAEVTVAGRPLGTTPLGNVQVPIGAQEIIFRHPQLGERRITATITSRGPNRVSLNMNQK